MQCPLQSPLILLNISAAPPSRVGYACILLLLESLFFCCRQDEDNLREALRYSAAMLGELRTSFLSPQRYYELYMQVFDELGNLEVRLCLVTTGAAQPHACEQQI
jgi:hypothetical protein